MKLYKQLHEMTEFEAFEYLQAAAIAIIKGDELPEEVRQWVGRGLLAMCGEHSMKLNEAFQVKKKKTISPFLHANRYAQVELARLSMSKDDAIYMVAEREGVSIDSIISSWRIQSKKQREFKRKTD
jgi:hypothetical protein